MAGDSPERFVATITKSKRRGKILVDYLLDGLPPWGLPIHGRQHTDTACGHLAADPWLGFRSSAVPLPAANAPEAGSLSTRQYLRLHIVIAQKVSDLLRSVNRRDCPAAGDQLCRRGTARNAANAGHYHFATGRKISASTQMASASNNFTPAFLHPSDPTVTGTWNE